MKELRTCSYHGVLVGVIAALVVLLSAKVSLMSSLLFFMWALYFMYIVTVKQAVGALLAMLVGATISYAATQYKLRMLAEPESIKVLLPYIDMILVFFIAGSIIFLEWVQQWKPLVPIAFIGTVLHHFFKADLHNGDFRYLFFQIVIHAVVGFTIGWLTVRSRNLLNTWLEDKRKNKIVIVKVDGNKRNK